MDFFSDFSWTSVPWLLVPVVALELLIRLGPKGRRTEIVAWLTGAFATVETSGLVNMVPEGQWKVLLMAVGYGMWRLRRVTTTPPGQA